jgi:3-hydroxyisobutyrate dehydrogenase-like beta-hydroxyacid dehydrogenase
MRKVGFIGLGTMGKLMAMNVAKAGFGLMVYDLRDKRVREPAGALVAHSAKEVAECAELVEIAVTRRCASRALLVTGCFCGHSTGNGGCDSQHRVVPDVERDYRGGRSANIIVIDAQRTP